jgi:hypothetical protein
MLNGHLQVRALLHVESRPAPDTLDRFVATAIDSFLRAYRPN